LRAGDNYVLAFILCLNVYVGYAYSYGWINMDGTLLTSLAKYMVDP
jgi:hypothetical protein